MELGHKVLGRGTTLWLYACLLVFACTALQAQSPPGPQAGPPDEAVLAARSLVSRGDASRLHRVFSRARKGQTVTIGVIGGSITAGANASAPDNRYGNRVAAWWRERFPKAKVEFVNAGIGATSSDYGAMRARRDLLVHKPDLVIVEFALNDTSIRTPAQTLEGLIRQVLLQPQEPAVLLLFMMGRDGGSVQERHEQVGRHYGLPMVSYLDAFWPEIETGRMKPDVIFADEVHPNDLGHRYAAEFITRYLSDTLRAGAATGARTASNAVPAPLYTDLFSNVSLHDGSRLKPVRADGWTLSSDGAFWTANRPGSVLEAEVEGRQVSIHGFKLRAPMGRVRVQVDGGTPVVLDGWFEATWGGAYTMDIVAKHLAPGKHRVRVELLAEKAPESTGHEYRLFGIGGIGTGPDEAGD